ncbi:hypothetical protein [Paenibacillus dokdonensis]|uniref:hypothetical protein n=1 Tax=Paenibacillus dokdonensis TaxID=2567944 RepID=UPI0010A780FD|nr:hypothetical protein [Paenibacillus dokdonensis]
MESDRAQTHMVFGETPVPQPFPGSSLESDSALASQRHWRVGTFSMGLSIFMLGIIIFLSQWQGSDVFDTAMTWWPIIFILLGLEILLYTLFFRKNGKMSYDVLSVFFVGFLSLCCLVFAGLSSLGVVDGVRKSLNEVEHTITLPEWTENIPADVHNLIIQGDNPYQVKVDQRNVQEVHMFANFRTTAANAGFLDTDSLTQMKRVGDTLYIMFSDPPKSNSMFGGSWSPLNMTVVAPKSLKVEIRRNDGTVIEPADM